VLLNDPFVHEMAATWAESILDDTSIKSDEDRARRMWRQAFAVPPTNEEVAVVVDHLSSVSDPTEGWRDIAHALYNAKAFVHLD